jgi:hypothetical protein
LLRGCGRPGCGGETGGGTDVVAATPVVAEGRRSDYSTLGVDPHATGFVPSKPGAVVLMHPPDAVLLNWVTGHRTSLLRNVLRGRAPIDHGRLGSRPEYTVDGAGVERHTISDS